jgi:anti-sigma-K factor RskA
MSEQLPMAPQDDDDLLAGEYVLGVLDPPAREAAQARIAGDPAFAARVARWEEHFSPWLLRVEPAEPAAHVWPRIRTRLGWASVESSRPGVWNSLGFWRGATALAVAASVFAVAIGLRGPTVPLPAPLPVPPPVVQVPEPPVEAARPVTVLADDAGATGWIARVSSDRSEVLMVPVPRPLATDGTANELWVIAGGKAPQSLGMVSGEMAHTIAIPEPVRADLAAGAVLAITVEPQVGIPHAAPSGPIVAKGEISAI